MCRMNIMNHTMNILWMEESLHQLVDGLSHDNPSIYNVSQLPTVNNRSILQAKSTRKALVASGRSTARCGSRTGAENPGGSRSIP